MFRLNHASLRQIELFDEETGQRDIMEVEYLKENTFNCYYRDENNFLVSVLLNANIEMNPERPDDLIVRTDSEAFKVDYYMDSDDNVTQLDYEGAPLNIVSGAGVVLIGDSFFQRVLPKQLVTEADAVG